MELTLNHKQLWFWLTNINGIGYKKITELLNFYESPEEIFSAKKEDLIKIGMLTKKDIAYLSMEHDQELIKAEYEKLEKENILFITREEKEFPQKLSACFEPPYYLYVKGRLPDTNKKSVAIVGARNCTDYGKETALWFASEIAKAGVTIISGLARGIDGYGHLGAIKAGGETYGVLGCGINQIYPKENAVLYEKVMECGGIISEYGRSISPRAGNFPRRNRLIAGLSDAVLVIEAKERSGSLITVDQGLEQGKDIFSVPGRITDPLSAGCNRLIRMGAEAVTSPFDVLESLHIGYIKEEKAAAELSEEEKKVVGTLSLEPKHYYEIASALNQPVGEVVHLLILLELKHQVKQPVKNYFIKTI